LNRRDALIRCQRTFDKKRTGKARERVARTVSAIFTPLHLNACLRQTHCIFEMRRTIQNADALANAIIFSCPSSQIPTVGA
jgi:hypothetical protein